MVDSNTSTEDVTILEGGGTTSNTIDDEHTTPAKTRGWDAIRRDVQSTSRRNAVTVSKELMAIARKRYRRRRRRERVHYLLDLTYSQRCLKHCAEWYAAISACMTVVVFFMCAMVVANMNTPSNIEFIKVPALLICACWLCAIGNMGVCAYAIEFTKKRDERLESNNSRRIVNSVHKSDQVVNLSLQV